MSSPLQSDCMHLTRAVYLKASVMDHTPLFSLLPISVTPEMYFVAFACNNNKQQNKYARKDITAMLITVRG